jgi:dihydroorotate dehydrogenase electron transfer subunit
MAALRPGDRVTVLGPLGRPFSIATQKRHAFLVIGGVGLPPLLWLAEALDRAGIRSVAFFGAATRELIPLGLAPDVAPSRDASVAQSVSAEFASAHTPVVLSTDDGSCGFHGHVVAAFDAYLRANPVQADDVVVYTCGPEGMMSALAAQCGERDIECQVCMERPMACGVGTCQSCIVTLRNDDERGWRYALCCAEGPVFAADQVIFDHGP